MRLCHIIVTALLWGLAAPALCAPNDPADSTFASDAAPLDQQFAAATQAFGEAIQVLPGGTRARIGEIHQAANASAQSREYNGQKADRLSLFVFSVMKYCDERLNQQADADERRLLANLFQRGFALIDVECRFTLAGGK